jgi:branched-chain amino acid transport system substrate-binding protein
MGVKDAKNHLVVATPWHSSSSPNPNFLKESKSLWKEDVSCWCRALTYDATRTLITALEKQPQPKRDDVQKALAAPTFQANGATGKICFDSSGERRESKIQLATVASSNDSPSGYEFVPVNPPTVQAAKGAPVRFHQPTN